jgi:(p)ppGpp synthase/HD superfamily hydrolase
MNRSGTSLLWQSAASLAAKLHRNQVRKDGVTPYIAHPFRVALTIREVFDVHEPAVLAAALLHDVIEDTTADYDDLAEGVGKEVADLVSMLTKDMRLPEDRREAAYEAQLAVAPWQVRLIKLADVYDNVCEVMVTKAPVKMRPKAEAALRMAGSDPRLARAVELVRTQMAQLPADGGPVFSIPPTSAR